MIRKYFRARQYGPWHIAPANGRRYCGAELQDAYHVTTQGGMRNICGHCLTAEKKAEKRGADGSQGVG